MTPAAIHARGRAAPSPGVRRGGEPARQWATRTRSCRRAPGPANRGVRARSSLRARPFTGRSARKPPALFHLQGHCRGTTLARLVSTGLPLKQRLERLRERIATAAGRSGRGPEAIRLVAVVKTVPVRVVAEAVAAGIADLGESRVQEAGDHIAEIGRGNARWHLIGHLQRNKAASAAELFDRVHSLDSLELARTLAARAAGRGRPLP